MAKGPPLKSREHADKTPAIDKYFRAAIKADASDLHLKGGQTPKMRVQSKLKTTTGEPMSKETVEKYIYDILTKEQKEFFLENGALDFGYQIGDSDRFRVNIFRQRGAISLAARRISSQIPPFKTLHLPPIVEKISEFHEGLILVTGPTGCGKSTTIASMIDHINSTRPCHIITIEDPIEFLHRDKKAIVSQREIGIDVTTYEDALRLLMRQDPDVVLIGEVRDSTTLIAAMRAAETGHLVFGTLHAASASQTIQRALDLFPQEERDLARQTFALSIKAVISQTLMPGIKKDAKRVPAIEILIANPIVKKLISDEREADLPSVIRACQNEGMQDFTESLRELVEQEWVDYKVALQYAPNREELKMAMKGIRTSAGSIL